MAKNTCVDPMSNSFKQRAILLFLWLILIVGLFLVRQVLLPFLLATLLAYVFHPLVNGLSKVRMGARPLPRVMCVILIYLLLACALVLICTFFIPQFYHELTRLGREATVFINSIDENAINALGYKIEAFFREYNLPLEIVAPASDTAQHTVKSNLISIDLIGTARTILNDITTYIKSEVKNIFISANYIITKLVSLIFMIFLVFMITGFMLVDTGRIKRFFTSMIPVKNRHDFDVFLIRLDQRLAGVVRGQLTICLVNAILTLIGLLVFKIKFAFTLATLAGIFSIVPIFGSILSTIPIFLVAITMSPFKALMTMIWIIGIHILEANLLNPKIMGDSAKIHPVLIILALITGEHYYGIIGALLAVPLISIIITLFSSVLQKIKVLDEAFAKEGGADNITTKEV